MTCKCVNDEGAPALCCDGSCSSARMINPEMQQRAQDDGFNSRQITQIVSAVSHVIDNHKIHRDLWVEGFLRGFEEGKNYG